MRNPVIVSFVLSSILLVSNAALSHSVVDPNASYSGPFDGASNFDEIAQEFEVSNAGMITGLAAHVPSLPGVIVSHKFTWFLLDATNFDYELGNLDELPVLFSGTAWSDVSSPENPFEAAPVTLGTGLTQPTLAGQRFVLKVRIDNIEAWTAMWIGGNASLPGEAFMRKGTPDPGPWVHVVGTEFGRIVTVDIAVSEARLTWSAVKSLYR